jgi:SNF2 family DNA or RNA helicase
MAELLKLRRTAKGRFLTLDDGEILALTESLRKKLDDLVSIAEESNNGLKISALNALSLEELQGPEIVFEFDEDWRAQIQLYHEAENYQPTIPQGLKAALREYQEAGFKWLAKRAQWGVGACLADDMGLGKTAQALALLLHRAELGPALVVVPMSLGFNWASEAQKFAPQLRIVHFGEGDRAETFAGLQPYDAVVSSYGLMERESARFSKIHWATVVLDEAQAIKNMHTKRSKAAMKLDADFRMVTTGTPLENHLGELWNLFRFLNPGLLGSYARFNERFAAPIERQNDQETKDRLKRIVRPFLLRRTKKEVLSELPERIEKDCFVEADAEERAFYDALRCESLEKLKRLDSRSSSEKRFCVLAEIMRLRRACCNLQLIAGEKAPKSAKMAEFLKIYEELMENGHKALVFSQFVDHLGLIRKELDKIGAHYQYLDGSTSAKERQESVNAFQSGEGDVFLISLRAGGLGLNLTAADYVIHMDPWWNPAVEDQASDRAHRIGQTRPVTIYRVIMRGSIEEKIVELHRSKRSLADHLLSGASDAGARLDVAELLRLLSN